MREALLHLPSLCATALAGTPHQPKRGRGGDEPDNLIAVCLTCHSDVHTETKLTRRFTKDELKGHRDVVYLLVSEGKLATPQVPEQRFADVVASILNGFPPPLTSTDRALSKHAVEFLLNAVSKGEGEFYSFSDKLGGNASDRRRREKMHAAIEELEQAVSDHPKPATRYHLRIQNQPF